MVHGMVRLRAVMWEGASLSAAQAWADSGGMCWCAGPVPGMSHLVALADRTTSRPLRHNLLRLLQVSTLLLTFSGSFSVIFSLFLSFLLLWVSLISQSVCLSCAGVSCVPGIFGRTVWRRQLLCTGAASAHAASSRILEPSVLVMTCWPCHWLIFICCGHSVMLAQPHELSPHHDEVCM